MFVWTIIALTITTLRNVASILKFIAHTPIFEKTGGMTIRNFRRATAAILAGVVTATLLGCGAAPGAPSASTATAKEWQDQAESVFDETLTQAGIPGGAIEIVRDGEHWTHTTGNSNVAKHRETSAEDLFAYRSITKSFTGTAILVLGDEGKIRLDDPIAKYVPHVPSGKDITIRMLLGMRSGLANYSATKAIQEGLSKDPTRTWTDDELLAASFAEPLVFTPGSSYEYSNTNTVLLGRVLEVVSGKSWSEAVRELVVEPLKLPSVSYGKDGAPPAGAVTPYQVGGMDAEPEELPLVSPTLFSAAGGLYGTVTDLSTWASALGSGSQLKPDTAAERLANASPTTTDAHSPLYDEYGLGLGILNGWIGHTGVGLGYQSLVMYDPASKDTVTIVINGTGDDPDVPAKIFRELLARWNAAG